MPRVKRGEKKCRKNNLFVITKTKDLAQYIITMTEKSPKKFRFTPGVRFFAKLTGAKAQGNAINKGSSWNYNTGNYTIHCTDGDIAK